jgi:hypothetical protein
MSKRVVYFALVLSALPLVAEAAGAPKTFKDLAGQAYGLLVGAIGTVIALALVIYLWNIARNMTKISEGDSKARNAYIVWGIAILFVMVSIVGIIQLIGSTLFEGAGPGAPPAEAGLSG